MQALQEKMEKSKQLYENLVENVNNIYIENKKEENNQITKPLFI
jgi:hypothetical protein